MELARLVDRQNQDAILPDASATADGYFFCKNVSGSMPACLRMARSVPSGMSPGWLGMVVNRLVAG